ncbi:MAG TPA: alpha/beta hydrolase [Acidisphaera sp.]|nr:alpha/beta hydrolase [Acidisphaera sp.]
MPYAEVNGQRLYYADTGRPAGGSDVALVFSHGLLMDHTMFAPQVEAFSARYRCVTWDQRCHGQTANEQPAPFSYYDSANDVVTLCAHLGVGRAVLAGMSQGGFLSMRAALTQPDAVEALILIDTQAGQEDPAKMPFYQQLIEGWVTSGLSDQAAQIVASIIMGEDWHGTPEWIAKWRQWTPPNLLAAFACLAERDDIHDRLFEINVPALVIHGEADVAIPLSKAEALAEGLPQAELAVIPGAGHAANLTHPEPVNAAIQAFLSRLQP